MNNKKQKWIVDEDTANKINDYLARGLTTLKVKRLADSVDKKGNVKENYDIEPVNIDGGI